VFAKSVRKVCRSCGSSSQDRGKSWPIFTRRDKFRGIAKFGGGSIEILDPGLRPTIRNPDRRYKASLPASKGWKPGRSVLPIVGNLGGVVVQSLEEPDPRAARGGTTTPHVPRCKTRRVPHADGRHAVYRGHEPRQYSRHGSCLRGSHAQPWSVMRSVAAHAMKPPRCSRKLRGNFRANAPCGVAIATSIYCTPSAVPGLPRRKCA